MGPSDVLSRLAEAHASRVRRPYGRCLDVSEGLVAALRRRGIEARLLRCSDGVLDAPNADVRWLRLARAPHSWVHYVVQVDDLIIDLTRRQFFPDAPHPFYADVGDLSSEWHSIDPVQPNARTPS